MKVAVNLYAYLWPGLTMQDMMRYGNNSNSFVIASGFVAEGKSHHIIVDPGHIVNESGANCLQRLAKEMDKDGIDIADIGLVINTHCHPDHCEGSRYFQEEQGATVAVGQLETPLLRQVMPGFKPDLFLKEGDYNPGGVKLQVINTPGHSPGGISLYWAETKALFVGDVIFYHNTGRVDLPGGSGDMLRQSIEKLSRLDIEYLLTGHQYQAPGIVKGAKDVKANFDFVIKQVFPYL